MLFLLNDQIAEIPVPEIHLAKRWKMLGCGDPYGMRAREALDFASRVVAAHVEDGVKLEQGLVEDLAALIIAKTGANAALFPVIEGRIAEPRLTILPETILGALRERQAHDGSAPNLHEIWPVAA